ncbi:hypothetical protein [Pseudomonas sp. OTU750018]|uniref:hypothetical protein n=1 Tax=Pseudomonas sp. OTU750018 TaxID=2709708 RepID=UPI0014236FE5|nr:hypothetical protein [Pseudomonas sp. OTU750018]
MYISAFFIVGGWVGVGLFYPVVSLSENQTLYIFSSLAQVVAAVYGLTITGYIFLQNQQDRLADRDETIAEALTSIKESQYSSITFLTVVSLLAIFFSILAIVFREHPDSLLREAMKNIASATFFISLIFTGFFVRDAMRPHRIEDASDKIKKDLESALTVDGNIAVPNIFHNVGSSDDPVLTPVDEVSLEVADTLDVVDVVDVVDEVDGSGAREEKERLSNSPNHQGSPGDVVSFLYHFNCIESHLAYFYDNYLNVSNRAVPIDGSPGVSYTKNNWPPKRYRISNIKVVKAMEDGGYIDPDIASTLIELIRYRNALVHGRDFSVSREMYSRVVNAASALEQVISKQANY